MKITNIKQQVKRKDRYSIFIDGKYSFALGETELLAQGLKIGKEFTPAELDGVKNDAVIDKGIYRALDLISRRPRSAWEMQDYLKRKKYEPKEIEKIISRLDSRGYINDLDFARKWVENRRLLKSTSKRKLRMELRQKKVNDETINKVLGEDTTDEIDVLKELIAKKRQQSRYQDSQKLIAYLARQGFDYSSIKTALQDN